VVTISSPIEDNEEEDGCEEISTQDSVVSSSAFCKVDADRSEL